MREGGGIPVDCEESNFSSFVMACLNLSQLIKLDIINCSQHATCDECVQPSTGGGDPFCGWCTLEAA